MDFSQEEWGVFVSRSKKLGKHIFDVAAPLSKDPKGGGITGTVTPASFVSVVRAMDVKRGDVFVDFGCSSGRPLLAAAALPITSVGFDVCPLQAHCAAASLRKLGAQNAAVALLDAFELRGLHPATHVYVFAGYFEMVRQAALLAARSPSVRAVAIVSPFTARHCRAAGLLSADDGAADEDAVAVPVHMPSGFRYLALVLPMTPRCRASVLSHLVAQDVPAKDTETSDLSELVTSVGSKAAWESALAALEDRPRGRACKRARAECS